MFLALGLRDLDQVPGAQPRGFDQHGSGDGDLFVPREVTDHGRRRLGNGCELGAQLGQRDASADIGERPQFDGGNQALENVAEQPDLLVAKTSGRRHKQRREALGGLHAFFRRARGNGRFDFVGDR